MAKKKISKISYWLSLSILNSLRVFAWLPYRQGMLLGKWIGLLIMKLSPRMVKISRINIQHCFPELSPQQQQTLIRNNFISLGQGAIETISAGWASEKRLRQLLLETQGLEALQQTLANKQGVILLFPHIMPMYFVGRMLMLKAQIPFSLMYHSPRHPGLKKFMQKNLGKRADKVFTRKDLKGLINYVKQGHLVWYAPDLDLGKKNSLFIPFFNQPASTLTTPIKLAELTGAKTFVIDFHRCSDLSGYKVKLISLENFPSANPEQDLRQINQAIEQAVSNFPEQYLWQYKRFHTQPEGHSLYSIHD